MRLGWALAGVALVAVLVAVAVLAASGEDAARDAADRGEPGSVTVVRTRSDAEAVVRGLAPAPVRHLRCVEDGASWNCRYLIRRKRCDASVAKGPAKRGFYYICGHQVSSSERISSP